MTRSDGVTAAAPAAARRRAPAASKTSRASRDDSAEPLTVYKSSGGGSKASVNVQEHSSGVIEGRRTPENGGASMMGQSKRAAAPATSNSDSDEEAQMVKRAKKNWSADAVALGYEVGTIKHSAYVLLAENGTRGMTVASIVGTAQRLSMYSWGTCKTPNNSVTAALSQDETFVRIAPSTYCLRSQLRGSGMDLPAPRTSSGSHDSGATGIGHAHHARHVDSGHSGPSGARAKKHTAAAPRAHVRAQSPMHFVMDEPTYSGYHHEHDHDECDTVNIHVADALDRVGDEVKKTADKLAQESYRRRMDVYGHGFGVSNAGEFGTSFHFPPPEIVRPDHSPNAAVAGSCLLYYPTASARGGDVSASPLVPTEATNRAVIWKDEAKRLNVKTQKTPKASSAMTLPSWVLEQYREEHNAILCDDL